MGKAEETDSKVIVKDVSRLLDLELSRMPNTMSQCYRLRRAEGRTIRSISAELCLSEQTVKNNISEASRRLRESMIARLSSFLPLVFLIAQCINESLTAA